MDLNYISFNGPQDDYKVVSYENVTPGDGFSSALKFSTGLSGISLSAAVVTGGRDAVVDVNNLCSDLTIELSAAQPRGQFFATLKGGSKNVHLTCRRIGQGAAVCEVLLDDWSDQSHVATKGISLDLEMSDGAPVRVIALKTMPHLCPGSGPYSFPWWQKLNVRIPFTQNYYLVGMCFDVLRRWGFWRAKAN